MLVPGLHPQDPSWVMMGPGQQKLGMILMLRTSRWGTQSAAVLEDRTTCSRFMGGGGVTVTGRIRKEKGI